MMGALIELNNITAGYENKIVLKELNFKVKKGEFIGIIGPNGGGKSTLLKLILGLLQPYSGTIKFYDEGSEINQIQIGYLPQKNQIDGKFPISVFDVILSGLASESNGLLRFTDEQKNRVNETLKLMGLENLSKRSIGQLSGGQLQRALLGRAIISCPKVLILDEPNSYIDKQFEQKMYEVLKDISAYTTILLVSHEVHSLENLVNRIVKIDESIEEISHRH